MQAYQMLEVNGLKTGLKSLLWSAAALVMLISLIVPALNILTVALMMVPFVVLYTTLTRKEFALHLFAVLGIGFFVLGPAALILGLFFVIPSIVMGHMYKRQAQARTVLTVVLLTILGQLLLQLVLFSAVLDVSLTREIGQLIRGSVTELSSQGLLPASWSTEMTESLIRTMVQSIPLTFIVIAFLYAVITHWVARNALRRLHGLEIPGLKPAKEWMMPKILVLYYLIALVLDLIVTDDGDSFLNVVLLNLIPLLRLVFTIQAIGFFYYLADQKRWNKVVPVLLSIPVFLFPPLSLIGVLDVAFPIRKSFKKP
ncbi:hypothetical protein GCM10010916_09290 [Paenibacillus abyssi]|uniref:DUF2232 domain-containing protein n=1 Tax=Paenibacillus abyssi TaxID=1340531 RepID=A0A917FP43_9BACL|nr:hypothetical protein GCM10010916_09290 [Paenibacillus abyssi]